jgi:glycosyltransferase involved in cell wall biosynthesis
MKNSLNKNICLFNSCKTWGGGEKWHYEIALKLTEKGYQVFLCTNNPSELYSKIIETSIPSKAITIGNLSFLNPLKIFRLVYYFRTNRINTVILGLSSDVKCAGIAAKLAGVKEIIYRRGLALPIKNTWLNKFLFKYIVTKVLTNSNEVKKKILEKNPELIPHYKIHTIYNGIDVSFMNRINGHNGFHKLDNITIIGNSGRLIEEKGQKYLIDLAKELKQYNKSFTIQIAGKGKLHDQLVSYALKSKVEEHIQFLEFLDNTYNFYRSIDIFAFPSITEGFSNSILEAMAFGKPVVAFKISSMPEIIEDGVTGYLVEFGDIADMAQKVKYLIENPEKRFEMGKAAKQKVLDHFNLDRNLHQLESIL